MKKKKIENTFTDANLLTVTVEHNGFQGGDAGHGGYVKVTFNGEGNTTMEVNGKAVEKFNFTFRGDSERRTLLEGLRLIVRTLEEN